jgi:hypothetical protein
MAMYQILNEIEPPDSIDLMTLDEMKMMLVGLPPNGTSDPQVSLLITEMSASIARLVNRVFGFRKVHETFYEVGEGTKRLYFSQWPVKFADIETFTYNGVDILPDLDWVLEESTGTLYQPVEGWSGTIDVVYSGGYHLPDEAPYDLKNAASVTVRESYYTYQRGMLASGVRMLAHKSSRIQFHQQSTTGTQTGSSGVSPQTWNAIKSTLDHYFRHWI